MQIQLVQASELRRELAGRARMLASTQRKSGIALDAVASTLLSLAKLILCPSLPALSEPTTMSIVSSSATPLPDNPPQAEFMKISHSSPTGLMDPGMG